MNLATRLRKIADLLDLLASGGLKEQAAPVDNNDTLECTQDAYNFCLQSPQGRELIQVLESDGMSLFIHEDTSRSDQELSILFEEV